jgi:hypothetical protein
MGFFFSKQPIQEEELPAEVSFVDVSDEELVAQIVKVITKRDTEKVGDLSRGDFYNKLDERIPVDDTMPTMWRMSMDHPVVYILSNLKHIQPVHIIEDNYGDMVIYKDDHVQEAVQEMIDLYLVNQEKIKQQDDE